MPANYNQHHQLSASEAANCKLRITHIIIISYPENHSKAQELKHTRQCACIYIWPPHTSIR